MMIKKTLLMVLMMTFGINMLWGQSAELPDGDGYYYFINKGNPAGNVWYLKPATIEYEEGMPYLTTNTTGEVPGSLWIIKSITKDKKYHQIIHAEDMKYVAIHDAKPFGTGYANHRARMHLESTTTPGDNHDFVFEKNGDYYNIRHKTLVVNNNKWWNPANDNNARDDGGANGWQHLIGLFNAKTGGSLWQLTFVKKCVSPVFSVEGNDLSITSVTPGAKLYYTTDGSDPTTSDTEYDDTNKPQLSDTEAAIIRVYAKKDEFEDSDIKTFVYNPTISLTAESYTYNGSAQFPVSNVVVGNVIIPSSEYVVSYKKGDADVTECKDEGTYTITVSDKSGGEYYVGSNTTTFTINRLTTNLNWGATELEYSGSPQVPSVEITNLVGNDDCSVVVDGAQTAVGEDYSATVTNLTGTDKDNYDLPMDATLLTNTFSIIPKSLSSADGVTPAEGITVNLTKTGDSYNITLKHGTTNLYENTDYEVAGPVEENGIKTWTITGKGNYKNSVQIMSQIITFWKSGETTAGKEEVAPYITDKTDLAAPTGMTPYIVSGINMTKHILNLQQVNYVPKDIPVLLRTGTLSEEPSNEVDFTASPKNVTTSDDTSMNILKVSTGQTVDAGQVYTFYKGKFVLTSSGTLTAGKFYIDNPNYQELTSNDTSGAPLRIAFDDTTPIDEIREFDNIDIQEERWFTLDGRQLSSMPTKKGLYINSGRKVVIK